MIMSARVEIDLDAIAYNIHQIRKRIGSKVKIMAVVKSDELASKVSSKYEN